MERALKKRLYVYTIGMFLATVVVVSVITIYYEYRVRYMATTLYGADKEAGKQLLYILFYGRQGNTVIRLYCRRQVIQEMVRGICSYMVGNIFHLL
mgnify:CR=1 FL=1